MARGDIMPFASSQGGHIRINSVLMDDTANFDEGDVVVVHANGDVVEAADEQTTIGGLCGVAAAGSADVARTVAGQAGTIAQGAAAGGQIPIYVFDNDVEFITENLETADTAGPFGDTPTAAMIGDVCSLRVGSGVWGVCNNAASSQLEFVITRVLDANKNDVGITGQTGVYIVFRRLY